AGDTAQLSRLPGVGKRTAETIVAQLRGKVVEDAFLADEGFDGAKPRPDMADAVPSHLKDAIDALVGLGYSRTEAERVIQEIDAAESPETAEAAIRLGLRRLSRS